MRLMAVWSAALVLWACAESNRRSSDDDGTSSASSSSSTGSGIPDGPFSIVVNEATSHYTLTEVTPSPGNWFVTLDLTLFNVSVSTPLSMAQTNFSLQTDDALVVQAHVVSASLDPSCRSDVAVAAGGMASCQLAFEIGRVQTPTALVYDDKQGHLYTAPVPPVQVTPACEIVGATFFAYECRDCLLRSCPAEYEQWSSSTEFGGTCHDDYSCSVDCGGAATGIGSLTCDCIDECYVTTGCKEIVEAALNCIATASCAASCG